MKILLNGQVKLLLKQTDTCPICGLLHKDHIHTWNIFSGETTSQCGAVWQIGDYFEADPSLDGTELFELLKRRYDMLMIKLDWIEPLQQAMRYIGARSLTSEVIEKAQILKNSRRWVNMDAAKVEEMCMGGKK
jgi:hypothetical protein